MYFCSYFPPINLNAFSILSEHLPRTVHNLCSLRCNSKTSMNFFFVLNFNGRTFVLTVDLHNLSVQVFCFFENIHLFTSKKQFTASL